MAKQSYKQAIWVEYILVCIVAVIIMICDTRTELLKKPRNFLSLVMTPVRGLASFPTEAVNYLSSLMSAEPDLKIAYKNLHKEYFQLKAESLLLRALQEENDQLRALLSASKRLREKVLMAQLLEVTLDRHDHQLLIGKGLRHGVYAGQPVIDDKGVIGQVIELSPLTSRVILITDPSHALPVQVQRNNLRTVAYGTGDLNSLRVPFLNQYSDIKEGDILTSSGLGGRFPKDYPVAVINKVEAVQEGKFIRIFAQPLAGLDRSDHVLLLFQVEGKEQTLIPDLESLRPKLLKRETPKSESVEQSNKRGSND